jgi:hypothetical protein
MRRMYSGCLALSSNQKTIDVNNWLTGGLIKEIPALKLKFASIWLTESWRAQGGKISRRQMAFIFYTPIAPFYKLLTFVI